MKMGSKEVEVRVVVMTAMMTGQPAVVLVRFPNWHVDVVDGEVEEINDSNVFKTAEQVVKNLGWFEGPMSSFDKDDNALLVRDAEKYASLVITVSVKLEGPLTHDEIQPSENSRED